MSERRAVVQIDLPILMFINSALVVFGVAKLAFDETRDARSSGKIGCYGIWLQTLIQHHSGRETFWYL